MCVRTCRLTLGAIAKHDAPRWAPFLFFSRFITQLRETVFCLHKYFFKAAAPTKLSTITSITPSCALSLSLMTLWLNSFWPIFRRRLPLLPPPFHSGCGYKYICKIKAFYRCKVFFIFCDNCLSYEFLVWLLLSPSTNEQINFTLPPDMAHYKANYFICSFYDVFIEQQQQEQQ